MTALIFDTSSNDSLITLSHDGRLEECLIFPHEQRLSSLLIPSIQNLLKKRELSPQELSYIAVGVGPGSYTGTRVGVAVAKSLALALKAPLISFCSLLAFLPPSLEGSFAYLMESKQGNCFVLKGLAKAALYQEVSHKLLPPAELSAYVEELPTFSSLPLLPSNIHRLSSHLFHLYQNGTYFPSSELSSLHLLYLHDPSPA